MYDVDGNGVIELQEMVKIVASIYKMMGDNQVMVMTMMMMTMMMMLMMMGDNQVTENKDTAMNVSFDSFVLSTGCCYGGGRPGGKGIRHIPGKPCHSYNLWDFQQTLHLSNPSLTIFVILFP